jgi:hypothetical protein
MIDVIQKQFTEITSKCLDRYAKEYNTQKKNMQLVFKLSADSEAEYLIYKDYQPLKVVTFLQVLGVKFDIRGFSLFVPRFIKGALERFCESETIERGNVRVVCAFDETANLLMWLYNNTTFVKQVELESLFDTEDILDIEK